MWSPTMHVSGYWENRSRPSCPDAGGYSREENDDLERRLVAALCLLRNPVLDVVERVTSARSLSYEGIRSILSVRAALDTCLLISD